MMNEELQSLVENFLSENVIKLEEIQSIKNLKGGILDSINSKYDKYRIYVNALQDGLIDYAEVINEDNETIVIKYNYDSNDFSINNKKIKKIILIGQEIEFSSKAIEESKNTSIPSGIKDEEFVLNFLKDKFKELNNVYFLESIKEQKVNKLENESEEQFLLRISKSSVLEKRFQDDLLNWFILRVYDPKYIKYRTGNYEVYVKNNNNPKEFVDYILSILKTYVSYIDGVVFTYTHPSNKKQYDLKTKIKLSKEYATYTNLTIQGILDGIQEAKTRGENLVIETQNSLRTESEPEPEKKDSEEGIFVPASSEKLRNFINSLIEKHVYEFDEPDYDEQNKIRVDEKGNPIYRKVKRAIHNKGDDFNYKIPGKIKDCTGGYTLITYEDVNDIHFWSKPTYDSTYLESVGDLGVEPLAKASNPRTENFGKWVDENKAIKFIDSISKDQLENWLGTTIYPFAEFGGSSWCTSRLGSSQSYLGQGSIYMILKGFCKLMQYAPSQSQFEFADSTEQLSTTKHSELIKELMEHIPEFIEHCLEGGKDDYVEVPKLYEFLTKRKYLPTIKSYLKVHKEKHLSDEELIDYITDFNRIVPDPSGKESQGITLAKRLFRIREFRNIPIDPWMDIEQSLMEDFINLSNNILNKDDTARIKKLIDMLGLIINGASDGFFKHRFTKSRKGAIDFFSAISKYMIENYPNDNKTKKILEKFSNLPSVNFKKLLDLNDIEEQIMLSVKTITKNNINLLSGEYQKIYYALVIALFYKELTQDTSEHDLLKNIKKFFADNSYKVSKESVIELSTSFLKKEKLAELETAIGSEHKNYFDDLVLRIGKIIKLDIVNSTVKNSRSLLFDTIINSNVDLSKNTELLKNIKQTLLSLKLEIDKTDISIQLFDPDYFDTDKDPNLKGLSLLVSILNKKHEIVDFASVKGGDFSVVEDLASSNAISMNDNGKYYLTKDQYAFLNQKITGYLNKKIFKNLSDNLVINDSSFRDIKERGILLKDVDPLQVFLERIQSGDIPKDFKSSIIDIFNESLDKKLIVSMARVVNDFYKTVGDYVYPKIDLTEIYEEFKFKYSK